MCEPTFEYDYICEWSGALIQPTEEDRFWYGHSLPPEMDHREGFKLRNRKEQARMREEVSNKIIGTYNSGLSAIHRLQRDAIDVWSIYGNEPPAEFRNKLNFFMDEN